MPRRNIDDQWVSDAIVGLEELDGGGMARSRSESTIPCNQCSSGSFCKHDVCSIGGRKIVKQLPSTAPRDSLQLAAALSWCEDVPQGRVFLTADQKLREAALLSGLDAMEI